MAPPMPEPGTELLALIVIVILARIVWVIIEED
jgi:hypothetical protein